MHTAFSYSENIYKLYIIEGATHSFSHLDQNDRVDQGFMAATESNKILSNNLVHKLSFMERASLLGYQAVSLC